MPSLSGITAVDVSLGLAGLYIAKRALSTSKQSAPYPPGPPGLPVLGNLLDWPASKEWETYTKWAQQYGDIVHVNLAGNHMVILNSLDSALALLDRKGQIYSDRPQFHFGGELVGWNLSLPLSCQGDRHKELRRMLLREIGTRNSLEQFIPMEEAETARFIRRVIDEPDRVAQNVRKLAGAIILNVSHGYQVKDGDDEMVALADRLMEEFSHATTPGAFVVDALPFMDLLPSWFPGTNYRKVAAQYRESRNEFLNKPHDFVKSQLADGIARPSFVGSSIDKADLTPEQDELVKWAAAALYGGGADTTVSAIYTFFLCMTRNPDVLSKAQEEIDRVIGHDRLPTIHDEPQLPYVSALVKEVLRWGQVAPQGLPHATSEDDFYKGYFIPKGTVVIPNIWLFTHNADTYPEPMAFRPERFLGDKPQQDPREVVFGFGRRVCPGQQLAEGSVFLAIAMVLATLDISPKIGADGKPIMPEVDYVGTIVTHPKEFPTMVKARSARAEALVRAAADASL